jgi:hypothetical protein
MVALSAVSTTEIEHQRADVLPAREALSSFVNITTIVPVNIAIAVNAATVGSVANAYAWQGVASAQF